MKMIIHPDYKTYEESLNHIPSGDYEKKEIFCNKRNSVEKIRLGDHFFVVKRFKQPTWVNRVIYTWFRKSKARRAFEYAEILLKRGIETARPVAYMEIKRHGLFHTGYFISEYLPYPLLADIQKLDMSYEEKIVLKKDLILFTAQLHQQKIVHQDYNAGNIFFYKREGKYYFALIDLNRLKLGDNSPSICMKAFDQLGIGLKEMVDIISQYASIRNLDVEESMFFTLFSRQKTKKRKEIKRWFFNRIGLEYSR